MSLATTSTLIALNLILATHRGADLSPDQPIPDQLIPDQLIN
jgi:hypothetical protein